MSYRSRCKRAWLISGRRRNRWRHRLLSYREITVTINGRAFFQAGSISFEVARAPMLSTHEQIDEALDGAHPETVAEAHLELERAMYRVALLPPALLKPEDKGR